MIYQHNVAGTASLLSVIIPAYNAALERKIKELDLEDKVEVVNQVIDTSKSISESHIIAIPFLNTRRSPQIPLSALESLACGGPVVASESPEIAEIIQTYKCGFVLKAVKANLCLALKECRQNYLPHQKYCRKAA